MNAKAIRPPKKLNKGRKTGRAKNNRRERQTGARRANQKKKTHPE